MYGYRIGMANVHAWIMDSGLFIDDESGSIKIDHVLTLDDSSRLIMY